MPFPIPLILESPSPLRKRSSAAFASAGSLPEPTVDADDSDVADRTFERFSRDPLLCVLPCVRRRPVDRLTLPTSLSHDRTTDACAKDVARSIDDSDV